MLAKVLQQHPLLGLAPLGLGVGHVGAVAAEPVCEAASAGKQWQGVEANVLHVSPTGKVVSLDELSNTYRKHLWPAHSERRFAFVLCTFALILQ